MASRVRLALLHRSALFRRCLASVLREEDLWEVRDLDHRSDELHKTLVDEHCDVLVIDLNLPDNLAVDLIQHIHKQRESKAKVVVLVR